jgi:alpha-tubulin suppressor-like RCC1 family protein
MSRRQGGTLGTFTPLSTPNAPTGLSVSTSIGSATVSFEPPADTGDGAITSFIVTAINESTGVSTGATGSASPITVSPGSGTFKIRAQAVNNFGPGRLTEFDTGNVIEYSGLELYSWGDNGNGELGLGNTIDRSSPVQVGSSTSWRKIARGFQVSAAITSAGTLYTWGNNATFGALGLGDKISRSSPTQVGALTNWAQISTNGQNNAMAAVKTDGTLWTWGDDAYGRLGQNTASVDKSSPVQVGALTDWSVPAMGPTCCFALKSDGTLWSWGDNAFGGLGQNTAVALDKSSPVQVGTLTNWASLSAGRNRGFATNTNGQLYAWGSNAYGALGDGTVLNRSSPVQIGALTNWSQVSGGRYHAAAVKTDGTLWTWGDNNSGGLGQNTAVALDRSSPVQVGALTSWSVVSAGSYGCTALQSDGSLWTWGRNASGQLGQNNTISRSSPVQVGALTDWVALPTGFGFNHNLALYGVV